jgi:hypothetical protein
MILIPHRSVATLRPDERANGVVSSPRTPVRGGVTGHVSLRPLRSPAEACIGRTTN